jgi:hypothetical protein
VKAVANGELDDRRMEQVRASLAGSVTVVRQLEVSFDEAVRLFEKMLGEADGASDAGSDAVTDVEEDNGA